MTKTQIRAHAKEARGAVRVMERCLARDDWAGVEEMALILEHIGGVIRDDCEDR